MPFFMQCPFCQQRFNLPYTVVVIGCPICGKTFLVDHLSEGCSWVSTDVPAATGPEDKPVLQASPPKLLESMPIIGKTSDSPVTVDVKPAAKTASVPELREPIPFFVEVSKSSVAQDGGKPASESAAVPELPEPMPMFAETLDPPLTEDEVNAACKTASVAELPEPFPIFEETPTPPAVEEVVKPASKSASTPELVKPIPIFVRTSDSPVSDIDKTKPAPKIVAPAPLPQAPATDEDVDDAIPKWLNPWGLAAFMLAVSALLLASLTGLRILTITLSALGLAVAGLGIWTKSEDQTKGRLSLALGGSMNGVLLLLVLFVPGVIHSRWAMDFSVPRSDPNKLAAVPRDEPRHEGKSLSPEEWVDAVKEAIRQDDVFVRVESVQIDRLADRGDNRYVLVHLRLANSGHERTIAVTGFGRDKDQPVLTDNSGRAYPFVEERPRKLGRGRGPLIFENAGSKVRELAATGFLDQLLIFEAPSAKIEAFNLEVPTSAWGRAGVCKFRCPGSFKASVGLKKGKP
jgi:hypothetical protein